MRLALDHHYSTRIAVALREQGHDAFAAVERGWELLDDAEILAACVDERRALLTNNVADFAVLARKWAVEARPHHGLVFTSDAALPRAMGTIGRYVAAIEHLMTANGEDDALVDQVVWLTSPD